MRLFYYHKIFVQCKLLFLKLDDCQQTLCAYRLFSLLQHTDQEKGGKSQFLITFVHASAEFRVFAEAHLTIPETEHQ